VTEQSDIPAEPVPPGAAVPQSPPLETAESPFARVRARSLLPWSLAAFVVLIVVALLAGKPDRWLGGQGSEWLGLALYGGLLAWELATLRRARVSIRSFARWPSRDEWRLSWLGLALATVSVGTLFLTMLPVSLLAPHLLRQLLESSRSLPARTHVSPLTGIVAVFVAPPIEELLFRGVLLQRWAHKWGLPRAAVLSSICFAVLHADPFGKFIFGMVMVWLYVRTDSLLVPALAHAIHNAVFVLPSLVPSPAQVPTMDPLQMIRSAWPAALASLAVGCALIAYATRGSGRPSTWRLPPVRQLQPSHGVADR